MSETIKRASIALLLVTLPVAFVVGIGTGYGIAKGKLPSNIQEVLSSFCPTNNAEGEGEGE